MNLPTHRLIRCSILALVLGHLTPAKAGVNGNLEPLYARQNRFAIPFRLNATTHWSGEPVELQLYVSSDGGEAWTLAGREKPHVGRFTFRAPNDGTYQFLVKTLDQQGRVRSASASTTDEPELTVVIDTIPPKVSLRGQRNASGNVEVDWSIEEEHLSRDRVYFEYRVGSNSTWSPFRGNLPPPDASHRMSGQTVLPPEAALSAVTLRLRVDDKAGNPAEQSVHVPHSQGEGEAEAMPTPDIVKNAEPAVRIPPPALPVAQVNSPPAGASRWQPQPPSTDANPRVEKPVLGSRAPNQTLDTETSLRSPVTSPPWTEGRRSWPADRLADQPLFSNSRNPASTSVAQSAEDIPPPLPSPGFQSEEILPGEIVGVDVSEKPVAVKSSQGLSQQDFDPLEAVDEPLLRTEVPLGEPSPATHPSSLDQISDVALPPPSQMVNALQFDMDYDLQGVGSKGPRRVELWVSPDRGRTWNFLNEDEDLRSPITVQLESEGVYGFAFVITSESGVRGLEPQPGDPGEYLLGVDITPPQAHLLDTEMEVAPEGATLHVRWLAEDLYLAERPISLFYRTPGSGAWTPIASHLPNTGTFAWRLTNDLPPRAYLAVEVRDAAGNVGRYVSPGIQRLDCWRPSARIKGIRARNSQR